MPCVSGRANHKLLRKDCPSGCKCCINTAYSCTPICCETDLFVNNDFNVEITDSITSQLESLTEQERRDFVNCVKELELGEPLDQSCLLLFPELHCEVIIGVFNETTGTHAGSVGIQNGMLSQSTLVNLVVDPGHTLSLFVIPSNQKPCLECEFGCEQNPGGAICVGATGGASDPNFRCCP
jgi:hypothetical protein